jgi:hypothetical protein
MAKLIACGKRSVPLRFRTHGWAVVGLPGFKADYQVLLTCHTEANYLLPDSFDDFFVAVCLKYEDRFEIYISAIYPESDDLPTSVDVDWAVFDPAGNSE